MQPQLLDHMGKNELTYLMFTSLLNSLRAVGYRGNNTFTKIFWDAMGK